ncbi:FGGY family carbohydrate kinase [Ekhidna sp.]
MIDAIAIFDIGKTNKKFFLFNHSFEVLEKENIQFEETMDEDGFPCEDLEKLVAWVQATFNKYNALKKYQITYLNFSTYGASLVYLDELRNPILPFYNYLKPVRAEFSELFDKKYNSQTVSLEFCSPNLELLNSGFQLFWLKHRHPQKFRKVKQALHFPQYLAYLFHDKIMADYTSIGCHTRLWDYENEGYHKWTELEDIRHLLPLPVSSNRTFAGKTHKEIAIGVGIHDSSAALIPYIKKSEKPFILLSTGTWNISLNPFNKQSLSQQDLDTDCLFFLDPMANHVKASRAMLGAEHEFQVSKLIDRFKKKPGDYWNLKFDTERYSRIIKDSGKQILKPAKVENDEILRPFELIKENPYDNFADAYFFLIHSLIAIQLKSLELVNISNTARLYIDGGFVNNDVFVKALGYHLPKAEIIESENPIGSALGAAMVMF